MPESDYITTVNWNSIISLEVVFGRLPYKCGKIIFKEVFRYSLSPKNTQLYILRSWVTGRKFHCTNKVGTLSYFLLSRWVQVWFQVSLRRGKKETEIMIKFNRVIVDRRIPVSIHRTIEPWISDSRISKELDGRFIQPLDYLKVVLLIWWPGQNFHLMAFGSDERVTWQ